MKIIDSKKTYKTPLAKILELKARKVLCQSVPEGRNTEKVTLGGYSYDDDDFE